MTMSAKAPLSEIAIQTVSLGSNGHQAAVRYHTHGHRGDTQRQNQTNNCGGAQRLRTKPHPLSTQSSRTRDRGQISHGTRTRQIAVGTNPLAGAGHGTARQWPAVTEGQPKSAIRTPSPP